jgi:hypothetical protein
VRIQSEPENSETERSAPKRAESEIKKQTGVEPEKAEPKRDDSGTETVGIEPKRGGSSNDESEKAEHRAAEPDEEQRSAGLAVQLVPGKEVQAENLDEKTAYW